MKKNFAIRQLFHAMCTAGLLVLSSNASASAFQLWEQDAASVGDYHSGRAAQATDASTAFYNPAGITRFDHQQLIIGDVGVLSDIKFTGTVNDGTNFPAFPPFFPATTIANNTPPNVPVIAQGGTFTQIPNLHYVAPLAENVGFGFSVVAPFGLRTVYGQTTNLRYAGTTTQIEVVDLTPSLGYAFNKQFSVGGGLDFERLSATFDSTAETITGPINDTISTNKGHSYGWGYHIGALLQPTISTRIGLTYHSQVRHNVKGTSTFAGPIAYAANGGNSIYNNNTETNVTLPGYTTLSIFQQINSRWDVKATAIYTNWSVFQNLTLSNVSGVFIAPPFTVTPSTTLQMVFPEHYRNTWNVSAGGDFAATDKIILRAGVGYDQSPVKTAYRDIQVPDGDRVAVAFGGHYQATKAIGFDLGYTHLFMVRDSNVNPPARVLGAQTVVTNGVVTASADVFAASITWDIA